VAALDFLRLTKYCFNNTETHIRAGRPRPADSGEDTFYAMKKHKITKIFNDEGFWEFYISQFENGVEDVAESVVTYERSYLSKGNY
jgi:hypothetical protein|tara:strand:- start:567 stop:824 length:258 start_codon:yes stop_codon:yes gene_type:complete